MTDQHLDVATQAYDRLVSAFRRALSASPSANLLGDARLPQQLMVGIAGYHVRIRSTSRLLHDRLCHPLAHLELTSESISPSFTIDFIDGTGLDDVPIVLPAAAQRSSPEQETQEYQAGPYLFTLHGDSVLTAFNQAANRTIGIVRDPASWPVEHYQQAIFISLYQHLLQRGLFLIHASAIGLNNRAILFSARSGAGKTTTMLTCVQAGFQFYSDDATLLRPSVNGQIEIVSLLGSMNITQTTMEWFPDLVPYASQVANRTGKRLVMMNDVFPQSMAHSGIVHAIIAPEITDQPRASISPLGKMTLLSELLPFSLDLHDTAAAKSHLDFLADMLEHVPCYRLKLGRTTEGLPDLLGQLLATHGGSLDEYPSAAL